MPRTFTAGERTAIQSAHYSAYGLLEVKDSEGNWREMSDVLGGGEDYFVSATISTNVDQNCWTLDASLALQSDGVSIAPLITASTANLDSEDDYAPLLDLAREWRLSCAMVAYGTTLTSSHWKVICQGTIDKIRHEGDSLLRVTGRDSGAYLLDSWIVSERLYGNSSGVAMETVIQQILDDNLTGTAVTLYVPSSPAFAIGDSVQPYYKQERTMSVMEAINRLARLAGFVVRYKFDASDVWRLTLYEPDRDAAPGDEDWTLAASEYVAVPEAELDLTNVRNVVVVKYWNGSVSTQLGALDQTSIDRYGGFNRTLVLDMGTETPVTDSTKATALSAAVLADTKDPAMTHQYEVPGFWIAELSDYGKFTANDVHYDETQYGGVTAIKHVLSGGDMRTTLTVGGQPRGRYATWVFDPANADKTELRIRQFRTIDRTSTGVKFGWEVEGEANQLWLWLSTELEPVATDPWPELNTEPDFRLTPATTDYTVEIPDIGYTTYGVLVPIDADAVMGRPWMFTVKGEIYRLVQVAEITDTDDEEATVEVKVANPLAGGNITVTPTAVGCTISPTGAQTISSASVTTDIATTGSVTWTVTRPAFQAGTGRVSFIATSTDRQPDTDAIDIPAQERDTQPVQIRITRVGESGSDIVVRLAAITPNAGASCTVAYDAGGLTVSPASGQALTSTTSFATTGTVDFTITKPAYTGTQSRVAFTVTAAGFLDGTDGVDVPPMARDLSVNKLTASEINVTSLSAIVADMGTLTAGKIDVGSIEINAGTERILMGAATEPATGIGIFLGKDGSDYEFRAGNPAGAYMHWNGSTLTVTGAVVTSVASGSSESLLGLSHNLVFSASDHNTVAWAAGTITFSNGASFSIDAGNTGNMAALTYIYLDPATSTTVLQTTTTAATAVGARKVLIAVAEDVADTDKDAEYTVFGGAGGSGRLITAENIVAETITGNEIAGSTITAGHISVTSLSAIVAELGNVTVANGGAGIAFKNGSTTVADLTTYALSGGPTPSFTYSGIQVEAHGTGASAILEWIYREHSTFGDHGLLTVNGQASVTDNAAFGADVAVTGDFTAGSLAKTGGAIEVTGSRGGNAALASLLTTLQSIGLIIDNTS